MLAKQVNILTAVFGSGWLLHVARRAQDAFLK